MDMTWRTVAVAIDWHNATEYRITMTKPDQAVLRIADQQTNAALFYQVYRTLEAAQREAERYAAQHAKDGRR